MKKVRISKRDPNKILKALDIQPTLKKKSFRRSLDRQKVKSLNLKLYTSEKNETIHSHRYKLSQFQNKISHKKVSTQRNSPGHGDTLRISIERQKTENARKNSLNSELHKIKYKSTQKSPYLSKKNSSPKKHTFVGSSRYNNNDSFKHVNFRSVRLSSLENKETKQQMPREDSQTLHEAKKLMVLGQLRKSILILKTLLKKSPENLEALFTASRNWLKLGEVERSLELAEKVKHRNPDYCADLFLILGKCYSKLGDQESSLAKLEQGLSRFPESAQLYIQKGKVLVKQQKYAEAIKNYEIALSLDHDNHEIEEKLILTYFYLSQYQKVLDLIGKTKVEKKKYLQIKVSALLKMHNYKEVVQILKNTTESKLMYYLGFSYYKLNDYSNALISLQSALGEDNTKVIKLLLLLHIKQKDFYEAHHLLERSEHLEVRIEEIYLMKQFIEGTLMLMKRNIEEGIEILQKLKIKVFDTEIGSDQIVSQIRHYIHTFLAYGYFFNGEFSKCKNQYKLHKQKKLPTDIQGVQYNTALTEAILQYDEKNFQKSLSLFKNAHLLMQHKLEPHFYLGINYISIFFSLPEEEVEERKSCIEQAIQYFHNSANISNKLQNNIGASVFYHKCILHSYLEQWKQAIICIDEAIQRSEENYWKFFYVRGLILATIHNFIEAINDISIAINLKNTEPEPYILRARCFQIQGEGNNAFKDLQNYIALRPKDQSVHKFAGQLLFENGAFEDAIIAFNHEPIEQIAENYDVFLTKSKTHFLLGEFAQSSAQIKTAFSLKPSNEHNLFDSKMIDVLDQLTNASPKYEQIIVKTDKIYEDLGSEVEKKRIFKQTEQSLIKATCYFYLGKYEETIKELQISSKTKQKVSLRESLIQGNSRQDLRDTKTFTSIIRFNISLCYLFLQNHSKALEEAEKIQIQSSHNAFENYQRYLKFLKSPSITQSQPFQIQVFPNRNKLSNFLPQIGLKVQEISAIAKMCIPFPKVEPPEIFPNFDYSLMEEFHINAVEKKPEAPWILKSQNVITFTGKIERYSRLQIQQSIGTASVKDLNIDNSHIQLRSLDSRRTGVILNKRNQF